MTESTYTSRIIKASALLADTKTLLANWDLNQDLEANLDHARRANIFGKASRRRVEDILTIFRQRYFEDSRVGQALVTLVQGGIPGQWLDPILYFYSVQSDATLRAIVLDVVYPRRMSGFIDISKDLIIRALRDWVSEEKTASDWGENTIHVVARLSLAALRDFGLLKGRTTKTITPLYLPVESFAFIAFELVRQMTSGEQVLQSEEWKLFFLLTEGVERFFLEAHQERLLSYYAAGSIIRLEFPVKTLPEYAHVLVERARAAA
jgi:hypothetical protein